MEKIELNGKIWLDNDFDHLYIGNESVSENGEWFDNEFIKLQYFISNEEIIPDKITEKFLQQFYKGIVSANSEYICGTEWTGCYDRYDVLKINEHDIIEELTSYEGKYCYLVIIKP
jgi:hypothetical protein